MHSLVRIFWRLLMETLVDHVACLVLSSSHLGHFKCLGRQRFALEGHVLSLFFCFLYLQFIILYKMLFYIDGIIIIYTELLMWHLTVYSMCHAVRQYLTEAATKIQLEKFYLSLKSQHRSICDHTG